MQKLIETELGGASVQWSDREYQNTAVRDITEKLNEHKRCLYPGHTGTGKTRLTSMGLRNVWRNSYDRIYIFVHEGALAKQWFDALNLWGFGVGAPMVCVAQSLSLGAIISNDTKKLLTKDQRKHTSHHAKNNVVVVMIPTLAGKLKTFPRAMMQGKVLLILDEADRTDNWDALRRFQNMLNSEGADVSVLGLTATPSFHPSRPVLFTDVFPKGDKPGEPDTWVATITQAEAMRDGYWKPKAVYFENDAEYSEDLAQAFKGVPFGEDGEISDTRQSVIMREFAPRHVQMWIDRQTPETIDLTTKWSCCDRKHADVVCAELIRRGFTAATFDGRTKNVKEMIEKFESGEIQHIVTVNKAQAGFDLPRLCQIVFCRYFGATKNLMQDAGRAFRPWQGKYAYFHDFALNFADHPYPCQVDWRTYTDNKRMFRDIGMTVCQNPQCRKRHDSIPKPIHPSGSKNITAVLSTGMFSNGDSIPTGEPLKCHDCGQMVSYDSKKIEKYAKWRKACQKAAAKQEPMPKPNFRESGLEIGDRFDEIMTVAKMYDLGLWELADGEEGGEGMPKKKEDKSKIWLKRAELAEKRAQGYETKQRVISLLPEKYQASAALDFGRCKKVAETNPDRGVRAGLFTRYLAGESPSSVFSFFPANHIVIKEHGHLIPEARKAAIRNSKYTPDPEKTIANQVKGEFIDRAMLFILGELNNCAEAQVELSDWLHSELFKIATFDEGAETYRPLDRRDTPKVAALAKWIEVVQEVEHEEDVDF
jgi:superfamily II DNA or RNA helicase